jgi:hypothetical protein
LFDNEIKRPMIVNRKYWISQELSFIFCFFVLLWIVQGNKYKVTNDGSRHRHFHGRFISSLSDANDQSIGLPSSNSSSSSSSVSLDAVDIIIPSKSTDSVSNEKASLSSSPSSPQTISNRRYRTHRQKGGIWIDFRPGTELPANSSFDNEDQRSQEVSLTLTPESTVRLMQLAMSISISIGTAFMGTLRFLAPL